MARPPGISSKMMFKICNCKITIVNLRESHSLTSMTFVSTSLERADKWDQICFPVQTQPLSSLLPEGYELLATDRQTAVVGERGPGRFEVFALQGKDYSLIPNEVIRQVVDSCVEDYTLDIHYSDRGEFSIAIILPEQVSVGEERLSKSLIINNSYSGKTPFTLQGATLQGQPAGKARISFYRSVCSNGLTGWADDFTSLEEYLGWLQVGRPRRIREMPPAGRLSSSGEKDGLLAKKIPHKRLDMEWFGEYVSGIIRRFMTQESSVTAQVYGRLAQTAPVSQVPGLITEMGIPKQLARQAVERLRKEEKLLRTDSNLWLVYNAVNYSLLNSRSSLTITDRYEWDEKALHHLAALTV